MNIKKEANYWRCSLCRLHDSTTVSFMGSGHSSCVLQLRHVYDYWYAAVVDIRQCTATTGNLAEICKRSCAIALQAAAPDLDGEGPGAQAYWEAPCLDTKCFGRELSMKSLAFPRIINIYDVIL